MRKLILAATGLVCLSGVSYFLGSAAGEPNQPEVAHKVGLIDMGYVFQEYEKLKMLREEHEVEAREAETKAKTFVQKIQDLSKELKQFNEGTPEYTQRETQLAKMTSDFDTYRKVTQKELMRKEAKMFHTVYLEVQDAVDKLCKHHGYTLVLRFNREELNSTDPQKLMQGLQRTVIFHRNRDDMSTVVLKMLNTQFGRGGQQAGGASGAGAPATKKSAVRQVNGVDGE